MPKYCLGSFVEGVAALRRWATASLVFARMNAVLSQGGIMVGLFTVLAVIGAGAASVYFVTSSMGMQLIRKKTMSTILNEVKAHQCSAPQTPLHEIYYSVAEERVQQNRWLADFKYVYVLRDAGCFDRGTAPPPEQFAELIASVEEKIRLHTSGVAK